MKDDDKLNKLTTTNPIIRADNIALMFVLLQNNLLIMKDSRQVRAKCGAMDLSFDVALEVKVAVDVYGQRTCVRIWFHLILFFICDF